MESSEFGCQLKAGNKGENEVKGVTQALPWVPLRNKEVSERRLFGFWAQQAKREEMPFASRYLRRELSEEAGAREMRMELLVCGCWRT